MEITNTISSHKKIVKQKRFLQELYTSIGNKRNHQGGVSEAHIVPLKINSLFSSGVWWR